ncbi:MAG: hypothetical protein E5Y74_00675 [Mesorhizobium sp.]|nr:MAG: hypothetical protein E5Y74_00675 [Mesorhizobium sp.]
MQHPLDYERITIPPHGTVRIVCHNWPTCGCGDDCTNRTEESPAARRILLGLMIAVAAIGVVLLWWSFQP